MQTLDQKNWYLVLIATLADHEYSSCTPYMDCCNQLQWAKRVHSIPTVRRRRLAGRLLRSCVHEGYMTGSYKKLKPLVLMQSITDLHRHLWSSPRVNVSPSKMVVDTYSPIRNSTSPLDGSSELHLGPRHPAPHPDLASTPASTTSLNRGTHCVYLQLSVFSCCYSVLL